MTCELVGWREVGSRCWAPMVRGLYRLNDILMLWRMKGRSIVCLAIFDMDYYVGIRLKYLYQGKILVF